MSGTRHRPARNFARTLALLLGVVVIVLSCWPSPAAALDPALSIAQYKHTRFGLDDGAPPEINAFAQSQDGYLWLGSGRGLYRYDGVTFESIPPIADGKTRSNLVTALLATRSGEVWVGYWFGGIAVYRNGRLQDFKQRPAIPAVGAIIEDADGGIWVLAEGLKLAQLTRFAHGGWETFDAAKGVPDAEVSGIAAAADGTVWIISNGAARFLRRGSDHFQRAAVQNLPPATDVSKAPDGVAADAQGRVWLVNGGGVQLLKPLPAEHDAASAETNGEALKIGRSPRSVMIDRDGGVWAASAAKGVVRFRPSGIAASGKEISAAQGQEAFGAAAGLSADEGDAVFEDREGDIWVGTENGMDRFRPATLIVETRLASGSTAGYGVQASSNGNLYIGSDRTLYRLSPGTTPQFTALPSPILGEPGGSCADHDGAIWLVGSGGIQRLSGDKLISLEIPIPLGPSGVNQCDATEDAMWFAINQQGLFRYKDGKFTRFVVFPREPQESPYSMAKDDRGNLLADYPSRALVRITGTGQIQTRWQGGANPVGLLRVMVPAQHYVLLGGDTGLARLDGTRITVLSSADFPWLRGITGIAQTKAGDTWLFAADGVEQLSTSELQAAFDHPGLKLHARIYDADDGLTSFATDFDDHIAHADSDGRIWFNGQDRLSWIDPAHMPRNTVPPPVSIRALVANNRRYAPATHPALDAGVTRIEIDYAALSLQMPNRVQFRYRLDGVDHDWVDPGNRRQAYYTNLAPGHYSFHVIAANNDGVWNNTGASFDFDLPPTFWQTRLFAALCVLAVSVLLWLAYAMRLRQVTGRLRVRMEVRLAERERIARELHDTLLQGFHGLMLRFQAVAEQIPPEQANRVQANAALDRADQVLAEGRDRVRALRVAEVRADLRQTLEDIAESQRCVEQVRVTVSAEGAPRALHPMAWDDIVHIAQEALRNSFRHAGARCIGINIGYGSRQFELRLCDDGAGMDQNIIDQGRAGHYGLTGMRERARKIKATLNISSAPGAGTQITLIVPANVAYAEPAGGLWNMAAWPGALRRAFTQMESN